MLACKGIFTTPSIMHRCAKHISDKVVKDCVARLDAIIIQHFSSYVN